MSNNMNEDKKIPPLPIQLPIFPRHKKAVLSFETNILLLLASFLIAMLHPTQTHAANRVVVLRNTPQDIAVNLVRELNASGFEAKIVSAASNSSLEQTAQTEDASAAIRLTQRGKKVEVWVADRVTGKMVSRTITLQPGREPEDSIIVLAAVELLRASLMEIYAVNRPQGDVAVDAETKEFAKPAPVFANKETQPISVRLALGGGGAHIGSNARMSGHGSTTFTLELYEQFLFSVVGQFSFSPHVFEEVEGTTKIYPFYWGAESVILLRKKGHRLRPLIGIGLGAAMFYTQGSVNESYEPDNGIPIKSQTQTAIVPTPFMKSGVRLRATDLLFLRLDMMLGFATEKTAVQVANRTIAHIGRPWFSMDLLLEITLW